MSVMPHLQVAFDFLHVIKAHFLERYSQVVTTAVAFEMNRTFATVLTSQMHLHNTAAGGEGAIPGDGTRGAAGARNGNGSGPARHAAGNGAEDSAAADNQKIEKVRGEIEEVKQVMVQNIDLILERGDKIDLLVDKSLDLSQQVQDLDTCLGLRHLFRV